MIDDNEWQLQERALAIERGQPPAAADQDPRVASYRVIVRLLADERALPPLPSGLAAAVLRRLRSERSLADREAWFERGLPWWMAAAFGTLTLLWWLRGDLPPLPGGAWLVVCGTALLASWPLSRRGG